MAIMGESDEFRTSGPHPPPSPDSYLTGEGARLPLVCKGGEFR